MSLIFSECISSRDIHLHVKQRLSSQCLAWDNQHIYSWHWDNSSRIGTFKIYLLSDAYETQTLDLEIVTTSRHETDNLHKHLWVHQSEVNYLLPFVLVKSEWDSGLRKYEYVEGHTKEFYSTWLPPWLSSSSSLEKPSTQKWDLSVIQRM